VGRPRDLAALVKAAVGDLQRSMEARQGDLPGDLLLVDEAASGRSLHTLPSAASTRSRSRPGTSAGVVGRRGGATERRRWRGGDGRGAERRRGSAPPAAERRREAENLDGAAEDLVLDGGTDRAARAGAGRGGLVAGAAEDSRGVGGEGAFAADHALTRVRIGLRPGR